MFTVLKVLGPHVVLLTRVEVVAVTIFLAPFAVARLLSSREVTPAVKNPSAETRTTTRDAAAAVLLATLIGGVHAMGEMHDGGGISLPCVAACWVTVVAALASFNGMVRHARGRNWSGTRAAATAAAAGMAGGAAATLAFTALQMVTGLEFEYASSHRHVPVGALALSSGAMSLLVAGLWGLAVAYPAAIDEAKKRASEAERALRDAELARLRGCLEPHFLLNALNAVAGLVDEEPREARRLLACLGDLYRDALARSEDVQTLGVEVAWLRRYAEILEARHAGSLEFTWEIDRAAEGFAMPTLLLQPLVENAVKHGALAIEGAGKVVVRARVGADHTLTCEVEDDGPGPSGATRVGAQGLAIVRKRLLVRYGDRASFALESVGGRTRAVVRLPAMVPT